LALHFLAALALFLTASLIATRTPQPNTPALSVVLRAPRLVMSKSGGGGDRSPLPPNRGRALEVHVRRIFIPPATIRNENPKLIVEQAALTAPDFNISTTENGDPFGKGKFPSNGPGGPFGVGGGEGPGSGDHKESGNDGAPTPPKVKLSRQPQIIYQVEPEYSEEARKVRFQGSVLIAIDVDANGRPSNLRVVRAAGLGLDEKALAAVERWRFRPALSGDRPVAAPALVVVSFHLL
jgi:periplasmic protein TonB